MRQQIRYSRWTWGNCKKVLCFPAFLGIIGPACLVVVAELVSSVVFLLRFSLIGMETTQMDFFAKRWKQISDCPKYGVHLRALFGSCQLQYLDMAARS